MLHFLRPAALIRMRAHEFEQSIVSETCIDRRELLSECRAATVAFTGAITQLHMNLQTRRDYDRLAQQADQAREKLEAARRDLYHHIWTHGCQPHDRQNN